MAISQVKEFGKESSPERAVQMTAAQAIVRYLEKKGVEMVFGIPGANILPFYDAVKESRQIRSFVVRHEQTGAFMADGYARVTGKVGVCAATSGPGGTNLLTGLYGAQVDSIPVLAFTGQVATPLIGMDAFQEAPVTAMAEAATKKTYLVKDARQMPQIIREAYRLATTGRKGPVLIDLPVDVQKMVIDVDPSIWEDEEPEVLPVPSETEIQRAVQLIKEAQRPVLLVGGGIVLAGAEAELKELAELTGFPVVATLMGKDCFPADHPLHAGQMGTMCNTPLGNKTILESDLVIALGGRFGDRSTGKVSVFAAGKKIIHVNLDPREIGRSVPADLGIAADVKAFIRMLILAIRAAAAGLAKDYRTDPRIKQLAEDRQRLARKTDFDQAPIKPQRAIAELREFLDRDAVVTHDCGISQIWATQLFDAYEPRTFLITGRAGTMGWGLGAAMAAKLVRPKAQSVNIVGDGSLGMSLQDIATAVKFQIPVVIFLLNNSLLGLIRQQQNWYYGERWISTDLGYQNGDHDRGIDFVQVAKAMGAQGERVERPEEIQPALKRAFASGKPYLIEVLVDPAAVCSMSDDGTLTGVKETV